jgi:hypothetical protein
MDHAENKAYFWDGVFTAPLNSNSAVACVFVAAGICLLSRCPAMNVYSDFAIPAFGGHVTETIDYPQHYFILLRLACAVKLCKLRK